MSEVVEAVYENGVLRPLRKLDLREGERVVVIVRRRGIITREFIDELRSAMEKLPAIKVDLRRAEELYVEGKMHRR